MDVKIGDEVLMESRWNKSIVTVTNVTPKGFIRTSNNGYFDSNGREKTNDPWSTSHICILTDEIRKVLYEEKFINETLRIMNDMRKISYEKAVQIREILDGK